MVVSSGYSDDAVIAEYEEGGQTVLKKPYSLDELQYVLNSLV